LEISERFQNVHKLTY